MNKYLLAVLLTLNVSVCASELALLQDQNTSSNSAEVYFHPQISNERKHAINKMIAQFPISWQEEIGPWFRGEIDEEGKVFEPFINQENAVQITFFKKEKRKSTLTGLAQVLNDDVYWILPISQEFSPNMTYMISGASDILGINGEKTSSMNAMDYIKQGLFVKRNKAILESTIHNAQKTLLQMDIEKELKSFTSNPTAFCGYQKGDVMTLRALEQAINKGKFMYDQTADLARDHVAITLLGVSKNAAKTKIQAAFDAINSSIPTNKNNRSARMSKYVDAYNYLMAK